MDRLAAMRAFVAIVDEGSLTKAAVAMRRSPPTMVRILAELEDALGVTLLRRTTRRMSLTEEGRIYLERCRRILLDVEETEALLSETRQEPRGQLRITAPVRFGQMHVAPALNEFLLTHPAIEVELLLLDRVVDLIDEGLDAAVRIGPLAESNLVATDLGEMRRVLCANPRWLRRVGVPKTPEELAARPCVTFTGLTGTHFRFQRDGRALRVRVSGRIRPNHAAVAVDACAAGLGFGQFLAYQVQAELAAKRLRIVLREYEPQPSRVSLVWPGSRAMTSRLRAFLDWMKPRLRAEVDACA